MNVIEYIIIFTILGAPIIWFIAVTVSSIKGRKKVQEQQEKYEEEVFSAPDPEPVAYPARVMSKRVEGAHTGGVKSPQYKVFFLVTFLTDSGETLEFSVGEEMFSRLCEHQTGTLITIDGNFFDFGDGEEIGE